MPITILQKEVQIQNSKTSLVTSEGDFSATENERSVVPALSIGTGSRPRTLPPAERRPFSLEERPLGNADGMMQLGNHHVAAPNEISVPGAHPPRRLTPGRRGRRELDVRTEPSVTRRPPGPHGERTALDAKSWLSAPSAPGTEHRQTLPACPVMQQEYTQHQP